MVQTSAITALITLYCSTAIKQTANSLLLYLQTKEKYEKSLKELDNATPQYMENMEQVFEQCQQFEEKRLRFFREVLLEVQKHLDLSNVAR